MDTVLQPQRGGWIFSLRERRRNTMAIYWDNRRYYSLDYYLKQTYGRKMYKISLDAGLTCPNRDGTLGDRGCIFCSAGGSGDYAADRRRAKHKPRANIPATLISLISRHIPIPMLRSPVCARYSPKHWHPLISASWISRQDLTALAPMCWNF